MEPIALLVPLLLPVLLVGVAIKGDHNKPQRRDWEAFGQKRGLTDSHETVFGMPVLKGTVDGFSVDIHRNRRSSGKSKTTYTVITVSLSPPLPSGTKVTKPLLGGAVLTALGSQDIALSDPKLDSALRVQGQHPAAVRDLLDIWTVQEALRPFFRGDGHTRILEDEVILDRRGLLTGRALETAFDTTLAVAKALRDAPDLAWNDLANRHGLSLARAGTTVRLEGEREGCPVVVEATGRVKTRVGLTVPGLHPSVRITVGEGGFFADDPILGGRVAITGTPVALQDQLGGTQLDGLRGDLLHVFQTWPTAVVESEQLHITVGGEPYRTLDSLLNDLGSLAAALRTQPGPTPS